MVVFTPPPPPTPSAYYLSNTADEILKTFQDPCMDLSFFCPLHPWNSSLLWLFVELVKGFSLKYLLLRGAAERCLIIIVTITGNKPKPATKPILSLPKASLRALVPCPFFNRYYKASRKLNPPFSCFNNQLLQHLKLTLARLCCISYVLDEWCTNTGLISQQKRKNLDVLM